MALVVCSFLHALLARFVRVFFRPNAVTKLYLVFVYLFVCGGYIGFIAANRMALNGKEAHRTATQSR